MGRRSKQNFKNSNKQNQMFVCFHSLSVFGACTQSTPGILCYTIIHKKIARKVNDPILVTYPVYLFNIFAHSDKTAFCTKKITTDLESAGKNTKDSQVS